MAKNFNLDRTKDKYSNLKDKKIISKFDILSENENIRQSKQSNSNSSEVLKKTRTARNNAETKLLQEAAIRESEGVKGAINAAKYYIHAKRKGKEVEFSEEFKD